MATVSVIMPAHNAAPYIGDAIRSVIAQTETDWELIVTDDGSSDGTGDVVAALAAADRRIRLVRQTKAGVSTARNRALAEANGAFIAFLDSDDLWEPEFLATMLARLAERPEVDVITGNAWYLGGSRSGMPARPWPDPRPVPDLAGILADEDAIFIMSVMRRRVYDSVGGFDDSLITNEDYDLWLRFALAGFRFDRIDRPLAHYRRHGDNASAAEIRMLSGILLVFDKIRPLLADRPLERRIVDAQKVRFERELMTARARAALCARDAVAAADQLSALYAHSGGLTVKLASWLARWAPGLLFHAYRFRRARQAAAPC